MAKQIIFSESISINYLQDPNLKKHLIEAFEINKNKCRWVSYRQFIK